MSLASTSTTVKIHDLPSGNVVHNYQPGTKVDGAIRSISWSKDGNWLGLVPHSGFAEIISVKDHLKLLHTVQCIENPSCISFQNTTKKKIALGLQDGLILIYDIKTKNVQKRFSRVSSAVNKIAFTARDDHLVAACENGKAYLYSNITNNLSTTFKIPRSQTISALCTNPIKRNYIAAGSDEGVVAIWDVITSKNKFYIGSHRAPVTAVAFSPTNSDLVVSTGMDRQFCFYDLGSNKCIGNIFVENSMTAADFSLEGNYVVMASQKGNIYMYDPRKLQEPCYSFLGHNSRIEHVAFRKGDVSESSFSMGEPSIPTTTTPELTQPSFEFSGVLTPTSETLLKQRGSLDEADSFMQDLGLCQSAELSKTQESLLKKSLLNKCSSFTSNNTPMNSKSGHSTSTPVYVVPELAHSESPIVACDQPTPKTKFEPLEKIVEASFKQEVKIVSRENMKDFEEMVRSAVKEEMKDLRSEINDLKNEIKYNTNLVLYQGRQSYLDLVMYMVKENLKTDENFAAIQNNVVNSDPLVQENGRLKERIHSLEEELAYLRFNNQ